MATHAPDLGNPATQGFNGLRITLYTAQPSRTREFHHSWFALGKVGFNSNQMVAALLFQSTYARFFYYACDTPQGSIPVYELLSADIPHFFK